MSYAAETKAESGRGSVLLREGRLEEAVVSLTNAVDKDPTDADAFNNRGLAYYELGRYPEAEADFREAVRLRPEHEQANNNLGLLRFRQEDYDEALDYLNRALSLSKKAKPCHLDIYKNLCTIYAEKGMRQEAAEAQRRAGEMLALQGPKGGTTEKSSAPPSCDQREYREKIENTALTLKFYR